MKLQITIPVYVASTGTYSTAPVVRLSGEAPKTYTDCCLEDFSEEEYLDGYAVVKVSAEVDVDELFRGREVTASVEGVRHCKPDERHGGTL